MGLTTTIFAIICLSAILSLILLVLFGQVTVRKLRKNPATKNDLGAVLISGWDIVNVAEVLSAPKWLIRKFECSPLNPMYANSKLIYEHTNRFVRMLAKIFFPGIIRNLTDLFLYIRSFLF